MEGLYNFLEKNALYIVLIIVLIVWTGIFSYLWSMDKRIKFIEKEMNGVKDEK